MSRRVALGLLVLLGAGCKDEPPPANEPTASSQAEATPVAPKATPEQEEAHRVVFSDRASAAYLLLVGSEASEIPTRQELAALAQRKLEGGGELDKLLQLIAQEPVRPAAGMHLDPEEQSRIRKLDLLGLTIDRLPVHGPGGAIPPEHLTAPVLVRALTDEERATLGGRSQALLLRAEYRNRDAVRGLRLLQTIVRLVAEERDALIYDADTNETVGVEVFKQRRLRAGVGNVAEQIAIIPFPDRRHGEGFARMTTRGMRRFGSPELELDGLPDQPHILDRATHLVAGLAYRMVREGEYDPSGYSVELGDVLEIDVDAVKQAYAGQRVELPSCDGCPQHTRVHLVERPTEPQDPPAQTVVRIVAPRPKSDARDYDHPAWVAEAIGQLLGKTP